MRVSYSEKLMEVKDVVRIAKDYVIDLFENEGVHDVGLEEIDFDGHGCWEITIRFFPAMGSRGRLCPARTRFAHIQSSQDYQW